MRTRGLAILALEILTAWWFLPTSGSAPHALHAQSERQNVTPEWSKATLCDGPRCEPARRTEGLKGVEHVVGDRVLRVDGGNVECRGPDGSVHWRHDAGRSTELQFLAPFEGAAVLSETSLSDSGERTATGTLRRLRLSDGEKLESLTVPAKPDAPAALAAIQNAIVLDDGLVVLSETREKSDDELRPKSYHVSRYRDGWSWTRTFDSQGTLPDPEAFLVGSLGPARDAEGPQTLAKMGDLLLVCAGPLEDILALDPGSGETKWRVQRLWEYQRGFIGPSVWRYFMSRDVMNPPAADPDSEASDGSRAPEPRQDNPGEVKTARQVLQAVLEPKERRAEKRQCSIVAGPVVLPTTNEADEGGFSVFVVTAQGNREDWPGYLSQCVVYELDQTGECLGMATLPRFVIGPQFHVLDESVVWCCNELNRVRLFPGTYKIAGYGEDAGNRDKTVDFEWHPHRRKKKAAAIADETAWLRQGSFYRAAAFRGRMLLSIKAGGFLMTQDEQVFHYPVTLTDLDSGQNRTLQLNLPFRGTVVPPTRNDSGTDEGWTTYGDDLMEIRALEIRGDELLVTFQFGDDLQNVVFDCDEWLRLKD